MKKFISCSFGSRGTKTGRQLWEKLKKKKIETVMTDNGGYMQSLFQKNYTQSKAEIYVVEGYNSILRRFLARLRQKTKCYTKHLEMPKYFILLLMNIEIKRPL